jgi:hypothetical protein
MIVMVPRTKRVTLTGRRLYNALMHVAQARFAKLDQMPLADYLFEAPLQALLRTTGSSGEDRTAAKRYLQEMRGLEVDWESTAPGDGVKWKGFCMLSEVRIEVRSGENWVLWSYPPTIMAAIREPARWARVELEMLAKLGTYTAVALYEICARYRDNPSGVTSRKPVEWWVDALSHAPSRSERREWRKFKNEKIRDAVEEISRETDLEIELIEQRQGRAVTEVQFSVRKKRVQSHGDLAVDAPVDMHLVLRAESLGIREAKLDGLIKEFGDKKVGAQLDVLERRAANSTLPGLQNNYSYLRSLLRNDDGSEQPPVPTQAIPAAPEVATASEPLAQPNTGQQALRNAQIREGLAAMTIAERDSWIQLALEHLRSSGFLSAVVKRRADQGDWAHGLLGATVVKVYGRTLYGADWDR